MTTKLPRMTQTTAGPWVLSAILAAAAACAPKPPPPHIVEVPIDQFDNGGPRAADAGATEPVASAVVATNEPASPGGARPSALATAPQAPAGPPPGQRLTAAECDKMLDKGAIQYGISRSMSVAKAMRSIPALRQQAQADSTFAEVTSSCVKQSSKTQYNCAMKSTTFDKWKVCLEPPPAP